MLNGLIKPDGGRIEITGRVNALISLGAGFNPILTGRENIYVNASVLGLSKMEVDNKLDEIIDFAEIKEFIDSPVQNYSSGMQIRLGFAVATALEPDVLLLDEVLAVGDVAFRSKCFQRIGTLIDKCAVIFVSHDAVQMSRICERSLYLKQGKSVLHDRTQEVLQIYSKEALPAKGEKSIILDDCVKRFSCVASDAPVKFGESIEIIVDADFTESVRVGLALAALREGEVPVAQSDFTELLNHSLQTRHKLKLNLGPLFLKEGEYSLSITILNETKKNTLVHAVHYVTIQVCGPKGCGVYYQVPCSEG
jgi:lipopolysaccharide transport system ATP-binding protein